MVLEREGTIICELDEGDLDKEEREEREPGKDRER